MAILDGTAAIHHGGNEDGHKPIAKCGLPIHHPWLLVEEGVGIPALALPNAPAELSKPAACHLCPQRWEGGKGSNMSQWGIGRVQALALQEA